MLNIGRKKILFVIILISIVSALYVLIIQGVVYWNGGEYAEKPVYDEGNNRISREAYRQFRICGLHNEGLKEAMEMYNLYIQRASFDGAVLTFLEEKYYTFVYQNVTSGVIELRYYDYTNNEAGIKPPDRILDLPFPLPTKFYVVDGDELGKPDIYVEISGVGHLVYKTTCELIE